MELVKNIFFNTDKLLPNTKIKISYIGKFFNNSSEKVFIHYGFGTEWKNLTDIQMTKTELGFQTEIEIIDESSFNFCFYNEKNEWDNNDSANYIFKIEPSNFISEEQNSELLPSVEFNSFYLWKKKFKLSIYKAITYLPNLILGKYKRKLSSDNLKID